MEAILRFLRESRVRERRWRSFINMMFDRRLSVKDKKRILYSLKYLSLLTFFVCAVGVYAQPTGYSYLRITDQAGRTVRTDVLAIEVLSGSVDIVNSTHYVIKTNCSALVRVLLYNITVWQGTVEAGKCYTVKASIVEMTIESPDPSLVIYLYLVGGNKTWKLYGKRSYTIYPVPVATYRVVICGSARIEKTIYFTGGVIKLTSNSVSPQLYYIVLLSATPLGIYSSYRVVKSRRRFRKHRKTKRTPVKKHYLRQEMKHEKTMIESIELKPRKKQVEKTKKKPVMKHNKETTRKAINLKNKTLADVLELLPE